MKKKLEFSKTLLIQESALIWISTLAYIALAFYCIYSGYIGSLPWLTASASLPWAAYGVSQVYYYKKSTVENAKDGVKYESVMRELDLAYENYRNNSGYYTNDEATTDTDIKYEVNTEAEEDEPTI